jgi:hypothetical protein
MTPSEGQRQNEQRRIADVVDQYENARMTARIQMLGIMVTASVFLGSIVIYMAVASAKDVVAPVAERVTKVEVKVQNIEGKLDRILDILEKK